MASQQTPNYKLSRWAGTDRILMDDFNSDNKKIDAILGEHAAALEDKLNRKLLYRYTVETAEAIVKVPIRGHVDWDSSNIVLMKFTPGEKSGTVYHAYWNDNGGRHYELPKATTLESGLFATDLRAPVQTLFFPAQQGLGNYMVAFSFASGKCMLTIGEAEYTGFPHITLRSDNGTDLIPAGSTLEFWGLC